MEVNVDVAVWTLAQPTKRLSGSTVDLSAGGALLWVPELAPLAATNDGLVGVQFERIDPDGQARLVGFLRSVH